MIKLPSAFRLARESAKYADIHPQVGATLVKGKYHISGHNKDKTHPEYANPEKHVRKSLHAELDCLARFPLEEADEIYVYREIQGIPAMARPCNHCMEFIKKLGIKRIYYTIPHEPFYEVEELCT